MTRNTTALFTKKRMFSALAVASVLLLSTGCAPELGSGVGGSGAGSSNSDGADNSNGPGNSDSNGNEQNADGKGGDGKSSGTATLTGKECFPGTWVADNADIQNYMEQASGGASISTTGRVVITYNPDGTTVNNYDQWSHVIKLAGATSKVERHGVDKGTYTVSANGTFAASDTSIGSVTSIHITGPEGVVIQNTVDPEPSVFTNGKYACSGDVLTMIVDGYDLKLYRE